MRYVFLDVDGVLNCSTTQEVCYGFVGIDEDLLQNLSKALDSCPEKPRIVLTTTWAHKWYKDPEKKNDKFATELVNRLASIGYDVYDKISDTWSSARGRQVEKYLEDYGEDCEGFVILDDEKFDYEMRGLKPHFIHTSDINGFTEIYIDVFKKILYNEINGLEFDAKYAMSPRTRGYIMQEVIRHLNFLVNEEGYDLMNIMAVGAYGSMNYGLYVDGVSDVDTKAIYVPGYIDSVLEKKWKTKEYHLPNGSHCELKDIREMMNMWRKQNINFMEILFTDFIWVNPLYQEQWDMLIGIRNLIARYDKRKTHISVASQALNTLHRMKEFDGKAYANVVRLFFFFEKYMKGMNYKTCIQLSGEDLDDTRRIRETDSELHAYAIFDPFYLEEKLEEFRDCETQEKSASADWAMTSRTIQILRHAQELEEKDLDEI